LKISNHLWIKTSYQKRGILSIKKFYYEKNGIQGMQQRSAGRLLEGIMDISR
jgi:hypothetical protein